MVARRSSRNCQYQGLFPGLLVALSQARGDHHDRGKHRPRKMLLIALILRQKCRMIARLLRCSSLNIVAPRQKREIELELKTLCFRYRRNPRPKR